METDFKDRLFPAFQIAYEDGGVEFWMMEENGKIIDLHHNASFYERAGDVWEAYRPDVAAFEDEFSFRNHQLTIEKLMRLQHAFPGVKRMSDLADLNPEDTFRKIAGSFG